MDVETTWKQFSPEIMGNDKARDKNIIGAWLETTTLIGNHNDKDIASHNRRRTSAIKQLYIRTQINKEEVEQVCVWLIVQRIH